MAFVPSPAVLRAIDAAGCTYLRHPSGNYAQFGARLGAAQYAALDRLFARVPELSLRVYGYGDIHDLAYLAALPHARRVCIDHHPITDFTGLAALSDGVEELALTSSARVPLADIVRRPRLRVLRLHARAPARDYPLLRDARRLEVLELDRAALTQDACDALGELTRLRELILGRCTAVADWSFLRRLRRLRTLDLAHVPGAPRAADIAGVRSLTLTEV
jgi:hypothetical protein